MKRRSLLSALLAFVATGLSGLLGPRKSMVGAAAPAAPADGMMGGGMMGGGMMGEGMGGTMSGGNMGGPMRTGMALFMRHADIRRTVTDVPGGVRVETTSEIPRTAALIQQHVGEMYQRLDNEQPFPYPPAAACRRCSPTALATGASSIPCPTASW